MKYNEFLRLLKKHGWYVLRVEGSHHIMTHPKKKGTLNSTRSRKQRNWKRARQQVTQSSWTPMRTISKKELL